MKPRWPRWPDSRSLSSNQGRENDSVSIISIALVPIPNIFGINIFISKFFTETMQKHAINDRIRTKA